MTDFSKLQADVAAEKTVVDGAVTLLTGLDAAIRATAGDQAAVDALAADVEAQSASLAQAVSDNTPAAAPAATA